MSNSDSSNHSSTFTTFRNIVQSRKTTRRFDPTASIDLAHIRESLMCAHRAPTGFNLQGWTAIVVHEKDQKERLFSACLNQPQIRDAPACVVFGGLLDPSKHVTRALSEGSRSGYYPSTYEASYARNAHFMVHGGPCGVMQYVKSGFVAAYSAVSGAPMISVPTTLRGYAWKQTMIPATHFVLAVTAKGLASAMLEGIDEGAVCGVVGLSPEEYTVPCVVAVGHPWKDPSGQSQPPPPSFRFDPHTMIFDGKFNGKPF